MIRPGAMIRQVLASIFRKPATTRYPFVKSGMPEHFRGKITFTPELCIGCRMCVKDCPSNAITINKIGDKKFECVINLAKCLYCAQCVDSCPKKALRATREFELASLDGKKLKVTYGCNPQTKPEEGTAK